MNTNMKMVGVALCGAVLAIPAFAQECVAPQAAASAPATMSAGQKIDQYIKGNLFGIQNIKKDANKRIVSVVVIGRAPLSSALSKARAKNQAFKKADANARAEFMKWLTTEVVYTRVDQDDVAIVQKGESLGDEGKGKASEASEAVELSQEQTVSVAAGFVKGMVQLGAGMNDDGEAVVVLGWNAATAAQTDVVREQNQPKGPAKCEAPKAVEPTTGVNSPVKKTTSVSDAADDFL